MNMFERKTTLGVIIGSRGFFNGKLALNARKEVVEQLDKLGLQHCILPLEATNNGAVETPDDVRKCVELFDANRHAIDGIVVVLPNFGDEIAIVETINKSRLNVPVLVQACSDDLAQCMACNIVLVEYLERYAACLGARFHKVLFRVKVNIFNVHVDPANVHADHF